MRTGALQRLHRLGLRVTRAGHQQQPKQIAVEVLDRCGSQLRVQGIDVIAVAQPAPKHDVRVLKRLSLLRRVRCT